MAGVREFTEAEFKRFLNSIDRPERFHTAAAWLVHRKLVEPLTITECGGSADSQKKTRLTGWLILPELQDFWKAVEEEVGPVGEHSNSVEMRAVGKGAGTPPEAIVKQANLRPCDAKAWAQHRRAFEDNPELTTDQAHYDWFIEHVADEGELLPVFATWAKYVRQARAAVGEQKNKRGIGHETRSVVSAKRL
jgi:hypothetical protein